MITGEDLSNIDFILSLQEGVINQSPERKKTIKDLRNKIHVEMKKFKIKIGGKKKNG